jgi:hypothetical protein
MRGIPSIFKTELQDESLEFMDSDAASNSDDVVTAIVKSPIEDADLRDPPVGRLFYMLDADPVAGQSGPYPVELLVRVTGKVIGEQPAPEDSEDEPVSGSGGGSAEADDGTSDLVLAAGGAGGILIGVLAGGAAAGLGRRRPA